MTAAAASLSEARSVGSLPSCPVCASSKVAEGPVHAYLAAAPVCWARFGEVLARDWSGAASGWHNHLYTNAYAAQHSLSADRRSRQSLHLHLGALVLLLEGRRPEGAVVVFLRRAAKSGEAFPLLPVPGASRTISPGPVHAAEDAAARAQAVEAYAQGILAAWSEHLPATRALIARVQR